MLPCPYTGERRPLLEANNTGRQPMMAYSTMAQPSVSVKVVDNLEEEERVVSQWMLRSDGSLELPTRPVPGASYFLEVCASDGNYVKIPIRIAAYVSDDVPALLDQSEFL